MRPFLFCCFSLTKKIKIALTKNQIGNITTNHARDYDVWENLLNLEKVVEQHGNDPFFIYRKLCRIKYFLVLCENKKFTVEIPSKEEHIFLTELSKKCFVKVTKRTKLTASLWSEYDDEIFAITVYR